MKIGDRRIITKQKNNRSGLYIVALSDGTLELGNYHIGRELGSVYIAKDEVDVIIKTLKEFKEVK